MLQIKIQSQFDSKKRRSIRMILERKKKSTRFLIQTIIIVRRLKWKWLPFLKKKTKLKCHQNLKIK